LTSPRYSPAISSDAFGYREHAGTPYIHGTPETPGVPGNRMMICLNAPGYLELVAAYTGEVVEQYPVDGMRWDILKTARGCRCQGCAALWRERTGREFPPARDFEDTWEIDLYEWTIERAARRLYETVKSVRPDVPAWHNHLSPYFPNPVDLVREMDIGYNEYGSPARLIILRGISGHPAVINGLMNQTPTDPPQPLDRRLWWTTLALGGRCYSYYGHRHTDPETLLPDSTLQRWHHEQLAPFYAEVAQAQPWLEGLQPQSDIGMVFSDATRRRWKDRNRARYLDVWEPILDELLQRNHPPTVLHAADLHNAKLVGCCSVLAVVVTSGLAAAELDALRRFVRNGGTAVVAGDALRHSPTGEEMPDFAVAEELGLSWRGVHRVKPEEYRVESRHAGLSGLVNPMALHLREYCAAAPQAGDPWLLLHDRGGVWPLVHVHHVGAGRWVWLALTSPAPLVAEVLKMFVKRPLARVLDPTDVRVFVSKREDASGTWIVHLVGPGPVQLELDAQRIPVQRIVSMWPSDRCRAEVQREGPTLRLRVEGDHEFRALAMA